jgi:hypothetical protein
MNAKAVHINHDEQHAVLIGALRVLLCEDDGEWFAQGIEIDYAATGGSQDEVKQRFQRGLAATVHLHLSRFGSVDRLMKHAPESVWKALKTREAYDFSMASFHDLTIDLGPDAERIPYGRLAYILPPDALQAA